MAMETIREMRLPFGVVLNKAGSSARKVMDDLRRRGITLLLQIPDDRRIAEAYSRGQTAIQGMPELRARFALLGAALEQIVSGRSNGEMHTAEVRID
jgi:MinD superfamily P-loop ATPase